MFLGKGCTRGLGTFFKRVHLVSFDISIQHPIHISKLIFSQHVSFLILISLFSLLIFQRQSEREIQRCLQTPTRGQFNLWMCVWLFDKSAFNKSFSQQDVTYFTLNSAEGVVKLFKEELLQEHMSEDEEEDEEHWSDLGRMLSVQSLLVYTSIMVAIVLKWF